MKTSEMIKLLEESLKNNGDVYIKLYNPECLRFDIFEKVYQKKSLDGKVEFIAPCDVDTYEALVAEAARDLKESNKRNFLPPGATIARPVQGTFNPNRELMPHEVAHSFLYQKNQPDTRYAIDLFLQSIHQAYEMRGLHKVSIDVLSEEDREWYMSYKKALSILSTF